MQEDLQTMTERLEGKISNLSQIVRDIEINDSSSLERGNKYLLYIKGMMKEIDGFCDPNIKRLHEAHGEALAQKKKFKQPLIEDEGIIKPKIAIYMAKLERIRREAEEKARREREEVERIAKEEEDARLKAALEAEEKGDSEKAEKILSQEPVHDPLVQQTAVPFKKKLEGVSIRKIWKWRITDEKQIPRKYLVVNTAKISSLVRATKGLIKIPGVETYSEDSVAARG